MQHKNIIETPRLILRHWQNEDLEPFTAINQDPRVMEHFPNTLTLEETSQLINNIKQHFALHKFGLFAATIKDSGEFIGFIGFKIPDFKTDFISNSTIPCIEIGWRLAFKHWGKGYATEGAAACLQYGFENLNLKEIYSWTVPANIKSIRIMEKIGMRHDLEGDFFHPKLPANHYLSHHVLYRISSIDLIKNYT